MSENEIKSYGDCDEDYVDLVARKLCRISLVRLIIYIFMLLHKQSDAEYFICRKKMSLNFDARYFEI